MEYNEIYNICQPVINWLKEQYPNNHKIVIDTYGAELVEVGKMTVIDEDIKTNFDKNINNGSITLFANGKNENE